MEPIAVHDPLSQSADLTAENIERLRELFPQAVTEDAGPNGAISRRIDFDVLRELLGGELATGEEKYGLNWHGKRAARRLALTPSVSTLRPAPEESVDWDTTQNLMIEGDNLEVLKLLQKSYAGKVKMIYIDPPYNTGKDFVYSDDFRDSIGNYQRITGQRDSEGSKLTTNAETSGRFHTDWLNMLYPRLILAKTLLSDDGVLFLSIDDRESLNAKSLGELVFGSEGFVAEVAAVTNLKGRNDKKHVASTHESILIFARDKFVSGGFPLTPEQVAKFSFKDELSRPYAWRDLRKRGGPDRREDRPKMYFALYWDLSDQSCSLTRRSPSDIEILPRRSDGSDGCWRWGREKVAAHLGWLRGVQSSRTGIWGAEHRIYLDPQVLPDDPEEADEGDNEDSEEEGAVVRFNKPKSVWLGGNLSTDTANRTLKELLAPKVFDFPKSVELLKLCIRMGLTGDGIALDFFAGSGTFGQAVMELNAEDGHNRHYIAVQLPQLVDPDTKSGRAAEAFLNRLGLPRTLSEVTKERLRRAAARVKSANPLFHGDLGFRVFKLDTTSIRPWDPTLPVNEQRLLGEVDNILSGRTEQDLLYELLLKRGLELTAPIVERTFAERQVFAVSTGDLIACLAPRIETADVEPLAHGIIEWQKELAPPPASDPSDPLEKPARVQPPLIVFRDMAFADDVAKSNLTEILKQYGLTDVRSL